MGILQGIFKARDKPKKQQLCIVPQVRNSAKFVPYKDRKAVCADLKKIYGAVNLDDAEYAKEEFREKRGLSAEGLTVNCKTANSMANRFTV